MDGYCFVPRPFGPAEAMQANDRLLSTTWVVDHRPASTYAEFPVTM